MSHTVTLVAAMGRNLAIGLGGKMPWHLPAELQHFKRTTMGKTIVMGRKTWQAIGRPLPGRRNLVVSRNAAFDAVGAMVCTSLEAAVKAADSEEVMVIGGGELYRLALPVAKRMVLTMVDIEPPADTWFPEWDKACWQKVSCQAFPADRQNPLAFDIVEWQRIAA